jgi:hypothetical protein
MFEFSDLTSSPFEKVGHSATPLQVERGSRVFNLKTSDGGEIEENQPSILPTTRSTKLITKKFANALITQKIDTAGIRYP